MSFDFNKIDDIKWLLDEGAEIKFDDCRLEVVNGDYTFIKTDEVDWENECYVVKRKSDNWEMFKKKVADYFLGVDEK